MLVSENIINRRLGRIDKLSEYPFLRLQWNQDKLVLDKEYKLMMSACLQAMKDHQLKNVLVDQRKVKAAEKNAQQFTLDEWFPEFQRICGGKGNIIVISSSSEQRNEVSKEASKEMLEENPTIIIRHCITEEEAVKYLKMISQSSF